MTVFLNNVPVPVQFSLTSDRGSTRPIDGQVRVRIVDANAANAIERGDMQNVNALLQLTNGAPGSSSMAVLPVLSVERGDPSNRLNWTRVSNSMAQFRVGGDGMTYVLLKPGFKFRLYGAQMERKDTLWEVTTHACSRCTTPTERFTALRCNVN